MKYVESNTTWETLEIKGFNEILNSIINIVEQLANNEGKIIKRLN
jgi:hypothetical protein